LVPVLCLLPPAFLAAFYPPARFAVSACSQCWFTAWVQFAGVRMTPRLCRSPRLHHYPLVRFSPGATPLPRAFSYAAPPRSFLQVRAGYRSSVPFPTIPVSFGYAATAVLSSRVGRVVLALPFYYLVRYRCMYLVGSSFSRWFCSVGPYPIRYTITTTLVRVLQFGLAFYVGSYVCCCVPDVFFAAAGMPFVPHYSVRFTGTFAGWFVCCGSLYYCHSRFVFFFIPTARSAAWFAALV